MYMILFFDFFKNKRKNHLNRLKTIYLWLAIVRGMMLVSNVVLSLWLQKIFTDNITLIPPPLLGPSWSPKQRREELA